MTKMLTPLHKISKILPLRLETIHLVLMTKKKKWKAAEGSKSLLNKREENIKDDLMMVFKWTVVMNLKLLKVKELIKMAQNMTRRKIKRLQERRNRLKKECLSTRNVGRTNVRLK